MAIQKQTARAKMARKTAGRKAGRTKGSTAWQDTALGFEKKLSYASVALMNLSDEVSRQGSKLHEHSMKLSGIEALVNTLADKSITRIYPDLESALKAPLPGKDEIPERPFVSKCKFCGGRGLDQTISFNSKEYCTVTCEECGLQGPEFPVGDAGPKKYSKQGAAKRAREVWNKMYFGV